MQTESAIEPWARRGLFADLKPLDVLLGSIQPHLREWLHADGNLPESFESLMVWVGHYQGKARFNPPAMLGTPASRKANTQVEAAVKNEEDFGKLGRPSRVEHALGAREPHPENENNVFLSVRHVKRSSQGPMQTRDGAVE